MSGMDSLTVWDEETGGYCWDAFYVYKHPSRPGMFAVEIQSGCSCYGYDEPSYDDLRNATPLTKAETIKVYREWKEYDVSKLEKFIGELTTALKYFWDWD